MIVLYMQGDNVQNDKANDKTDDDGIENNIKYVSTARDLSPKYSHSLIAKRGTSQNIPLQVKTRNNKGKALSSKQ